MSMKVYQYPACSTCRKALAFLREHEIPHEPVDIVKNPPTKTELRRVAAAVGDTKRLFNTSGEVYREMKLKDRLGSLSEAEIFDLLAAHGKLIKRPLIASNDVQLVGFKEDEWREAFGV